MGKRYILDTNTVLDYMGDKLPENSKNALAQIIDDEINLSVINKIELLGFAKVDQDLIDFVNCSNIYQLDEDITELTIEIRKKYHIKLPDAIIAATALYHRLILFTNNTSDFDKIKGIKLMNPYRFITER